MSDDRIQQGLEAYANQLQRTAGLAPAAEIRRRAARRRRNQATGAAFAAVLIAAIGLGTAVGHNPDRRLNPADPSPHTPSSPSPPAPSSPAPPSRTSTVKSNVSQLREIGIDLETGVLIDVADDGVDRWMQVSANDVVDFTGAARDDSTEMSLRPAPITTKNAVVIIPPARPESCVADTPQESLILQPCRDGDQAQTWKVVPAGDSGQFELQGQYGILKVDERLVAADQSGRTGLQTIPIDR